MEFKSTSDPPLKLASVHRHVDILGVKRFVGETTLYILKLLRKDSLRDAKL